MSDRTRVKRNFIWNTIGLVCETAVGFLVMPVLLAGLGKTTYGIWLVLGAVASYSALLEIGIRSSIGRHIAFHVSRTDGSAVRQTLTTGVALLVGLAFIALAILFAFEGTFFQLYEKDIPPTDLPLAHRAYQLVVLNFACMLVANAFDAALWGLQRFDLINLIDIPNTILKFILAILLVRSSDDLVTLAWLTLGLTLFVGLSKAVLAFRASPDCRIGFDSLSGEAAREIVGFGKWSGLNTLGRLTRTQLGPIVVGAYLALELVPGYNAASRLALTIGAALGALTGVLTPLATSLHATDQGDRERRLLLTGGELTAALSCFLVGFLIALGGPLILLWLPSLPSTPEKLLIILALGELLPCTQFVTMGVIVAKAQHRSLAINSLLETVAVCGLTFALVPFFDEIGVGFAAAIPAFVFRGLLPMILGCRLVGISLVNYSVRVLGPSALAALGAALIIWLVRVAAQLPGWAGLVFGFTLYSVVFFGILFALLGRSRLAAWRTIVMGRQNAEPALPTQPDGVAIHESNLPVVHRQ